MEEKVVEAMVEVKAAEETEEGMEEEVKVAAEEEEEMGVEAMVEAGGLWRARKWWWRHGRRWRRGWRW